MTEEEGSYVNGLIDQEGFDYALRYKTSFSEIKDEKFHKLVDDYIIAAEAIEEYLPDAEWM